MLENLIGKRYAEALSDALKDDSGLTPALENLRAFCEAFENETQLRKFLAHPSIPLEKKIALVKELCDRFHVMDRVRNLVQMLTERKKILYLESVADYFEKVVDDRLNQVRVSVTSASPLDPVLIERLEKELGAILGKNVLLETQVDESLIGGLQLRIGDQVADASIKNRLSQLKKIIVKEEVA